jgi:hypothetical protein
MHHALQVFCGPWRHNSIYNIVFGITSQPFYLRETNPPPWSIEKKLMQMSARQNYSPLQTGTSLALRAWLLYIISGEI